MFRITLPACWSCCASLGVIEKRWLKSTSRQCDKRSTKRRRQDTCGRGNTELYDQSQTRPCRLKGTWGWITEDTDIAIRATYRCTHVAFVIEISTSARRGDTIVQGEYFGRGSLHILSSQGVSRRIGIWRHNMQAIRPLITPYSSAARRLCANELPMRANEPP